MIVSIENYQNDAVAEWILTFAYYHRRDYLINKTELLENVPENLLPTLPSENHLFRIVHNMVNNEYLRNTGYDLSVTIDDKGIFTFRKELQPQIQKVRQENYGKIIDSLDANKSIKTQIKEFFKKNTDLSSDEFNERLREILWTFGKEGILIIFKLIVSG